MMRTNEMGRVLRGLVAPVAVFALVGCYQHTYHVGSGAPTGSLVYENWTNHWLWGLVSPEEAVVLDAVCPSGNATIRSETTFLNGLVSALTSGIYTPTTVQVRCDTGSNGDLDLDATGVARIVSDPAFLDWVEAVAPELVAEAEAAQQLLQP